MDDAGLLRRAASTRLLSPFDTTRRYPDGDGGVDISASFTASSSHEDDDMKGSDRWRLHSDESTISSRVTTPDPVPPSPLLSGSSPAGGRTPLASRTSTIPPPPPANYTSPPGRGRGRGWSHGLGRGRGQGRAPIVPKGSSTRVLQPGIPPRHPFLKVNLSRLPPPPPSVLPPPPPIRRLRSSGNGELKNGPRQTHATEQHKKPATVSQDFAQPSSAIQIPAKSKLGFKDGGAEHRDKPSQKRMLKRGRVPRRPASFHQDSGESDDESLTFSLQKRELDESWSSASLSDEDPISYRNTRQFPPQLPAGHSYRSSVPRSRSSATNHIAAWVSQYEKSKSPARTRLRSPAFDGGQPADVGSQRDGSLVSDLSSHGEIELLWQQLKEKRARLSDIRTQMRMRRSSLRNARRHKDDAENALMGIIRPVLIRQGGGVRTSSFNLLDEKLENMQRLRDEYQVMESNYESLEVTLDEEEEELSSLETQFFSILAAGQPASERQDPPPHDPEGDESNDSAEVPYELIGISRDGPLEEPHPLYVELTSAIGDLENAKEDYEDLFWVKEQFEYERELKDATGQKPSDDMEEFLSDFPSDEQRMKSAVDTLENDVQHLKQVCEEKGVMRRHLSVRMEYALNPQIKYEDLDLEDTETILAGHTTLAHATFSELLSQPNHLLANPEPLTPLGALKAATMLPDNDPNKNIQKRLASKEYGIDTLMKDCDGGKKADFVNRWLLHQLRLSPMNASLLQSIFVSSRSLKIRDSWRWQCDVMYYWWRDNTMSLTDSFFKHETSTASEYSSRLGTPQLSRAASDVVHRPRQHTHRIANSDAMTTHG